MKVCLFRIAVFLFTVPFAWGQSNPRIGYVYPAGGQLGTKFQVEIAGQSLRTITNAFVSGIGVRAVVSQSLLPPSGKEVQELRDKLKELQNLREGKPAATNSVFAGLSRAEMKKEAEEIRRKLNAFQKQRVNPALAEVALLEVAIARDAPVGARELRVATTTGLSNPLMFHVGQLKEFKKAEKEFPSEPPSREPQATAMTETEIALPSTVNGQILPGGVDRFRFTARRGQRLVAIVEARELIPYIADAVPGWFQAVLTLYDAQTNEVAYTDNYRFHPDPVLFYEIQKEGTYFLEIRDALYRGREDFVYRVTVGELPFVTGVYPLGGCAGKTVSYEVHGWNLSVLRSTMNLAKASPGIYPIHFNNRGVLSNPTPFAVDNLPEVSEKEPNDALISAQFIRLPAIINGRINRPGDTDVFYFKGNAGDEVVGEVYARRLDSPLDSMLKLTDTTGKQLAFNDDHEDKGAGLDTHHADSYLRFTLPSSGRYYFHVGDAQQKGGEAYAYRLRLSAPRPDFALRVTPSSLSVRGTTAPLIVYALRQDGFTNAIALALKNGPEGFQLTGGGVAAGQEQAKLTLVTPLGAPKMEPILLLVEGRATIQGREVVHEAVPSEDMMQAFAYRHLVPSQELRVMVAAPMPPRPPIQILSPLPIKVFPGGTAVVKVVTPAEAVSKNVQMELDNPTEGISIKSWTLKERETEIVFEADARKVMAGQKGNMRVNILLKREKGKPQPPPVGTLPAIPYVIVVKP